MYQPPIRQIRTIEKNIFFYSKQSYNGKKYCPIALTDKNKQRFRSCFEMNPLKFIKCPYIATPVSLSELFIVLLPA